MIQEMQKIQNQSSSFSFRQPNLNSIHSVPGEVRSADPRSSDPRTGNARVGEMRSDAHNGAPQSTGAKSGYVKNAYKEAQKNPASDLARVFHTALVSTHVASQQNSLAEIQALTEGTAFKAILNSVRQMAQVQGISDRQAAEEIIQTFRKMDKIWGEYLMKEGTEQLRQKKATRARG